MSGARVVAVVVTFNRQRLLLECLDALARQTHSLAGAIVVDNASSDGTREALGAERDLLERLPVDYLRLRRNGGAAEGEHYGMAAALDRDADWIWVMDDDCEPAADALEQLLGAAAWRDPSTAALVPRAVSPDGNDLPLDRGMIRPRWFLAPLTPPAPRDSARPEAVIDFSTFVGPLISTSAARAAGLPLREAFIRNEDVEYFARLRRAGRSWLIRDSVLVHKPARPFVDASFRARARDYLRPDPFAEEWKHLYALRNLVYAGRRHGFLNAPRALAYVSTQAARRLLFAERRRRTALLTALFGWHGWQGRFLNVPPDRWAGLATARSAVRYLRENALEYDADTTEPVRRLTAR
jgi:GT2 family glycosyltransferase